MKKIILKILLCLNICVEIYSKCDGDDQKKTAKECAENYKNGKYPDLCCLEKQYSNSDTASIVGCKTVPYSSYYNKTFKEYRDGILYEVECDTTLDESYTLERCGNTFNENPSKKECKRYSTYVDSCCYYPGKNKDGDPSIDGTKYKKGCYWLGSKYEGSIYWAGASLECSFKFLKYSLFAMLYLIIQL